MIDEIAICADCGDPIFDGEECIYYDGDWYCLDCFPDVAVQTLIEEDRAEHRIANRAYLDEYVEEYMPDGTEY